MDVKSSDTLCSADAYRETSTPARPNIRLDASVDDVSWYMSEKKMTREMRAWMISLAHSLHG